MGGFTEGPGRGARHAATPVVPTTGAEVTDDGWSTAAVAQRHPRVRQSDLRQPRQARAKQKSHQVLASKPGPTAGFRSSSQTALETSSSVDHDRPARPSSPRQTHSYYLVAMDPQTSADARGILMESDGAGGNHAAALSKGAELVGDGPPRLHQWYHRQPQQGIAKTQSRQARELLGQQAPLTLYQNWGCTSLDESLPEELKPHPKDASGRKWSCEDAQDRTALPPSMWPSELKQQLAKLVRASPGRKQDVHDLLAAQVAQRQSSGTHPEFYAREVFASDIKAVISADPEMSKRAREANSADLVKRRERQKLAKKRDREESDALVMKAKQAGPANAGFAQPDSDDFAMR